MAQASSAQHSQPDALTQLLSLAESRKTNPLTYAGDLSPQEAYRYLEANNAALIDVRSLPEWQFTGVPDLIGTQGRLVTISWKTYPDFALNPRFTGQMASEELTKETPLFFLCRSGGRSLDAAVAMTAAGYHYCFNIAGGFEGEPDEKGHRGRKQGWKAATLPWKQG